jgi:hypothetical protein
MEQVVVEEKHRQHSGASSSDIECMRQRKMSPKSSESNKGVKASPAFIRVLPVAVELFITRAYKSPLWLIASFLFCASVSYWISFGSSLPEERVKLASLNEELRIHEQEWGKYLEFIDKAKPALQSARQSRDYFVDYIGLDNFDVSKARKGSSLAAHASILLRQLVNSIRGTTFRTPQLTESSKNLEEILTPLYEETSVIGSLSEVWTHL